MKLLDIEESISRNRSEEDPLLNEVAVGIDFGTTNSLIGSVINGSRVLFNDGFDDIIPSIIAVHKDGEILVGRDASLKMNDNSYIIIHSIKRIVAMIGAQFTKYDGIGYNVKRSNNAYIVSVWDQEYQIVDLVSRVIRYLKLIAEKQSNKIVKRCVITVPAYFDEIGRQIIRFACELAEMNVMRIVNEPTAAALSYGIDHNIDGIYGVYDIGGGTFDVSIIRVQRGVFQVLATGGDTMLGGDDFDDLLLDLIRQKGVDHNVSREVITKIKHDLSINDITKILLGTMQVEILRDDFENLIASIVKKTIKIFESVLSDSGCHKSQLLGVMLVGGSTRIPLVKSMVERFCDIVPILKDLDPDKIVATGAIIKACELSSIGTKNLLIDVNPLSIGLELMGGIVEKIIPRNTSIPISISKSFTTFQDWQTSIDMNIVQGEREFAKDCRSLAKFKLSGIPAMRAGSAKVIVKFKLDVDGILTVSAVEEDTQISQHIEIRPSYGISFDDIRNIVKESIDNAKIDMEQRLLSEAKLSAEKILLSLKDALNIDRDLLSNAENDLLVEKMRYLEKAIIGSDKSEIKKAYNDLEQESHRFSELRIKKYLPAMEM